jgi:hypothetical protein
VNDDVNSIWEGKAVACFKALSKKLPVRTVENHT